MSSVAGPYLFPKQAFPLRFHFFTEEQKVLEITIEEPESMEVFTVPPLSKMLGRSITNCVVVTADGEIECSG